MGGTVQTAGGHRRRSTTVAAAVVAALVLALTPTPPASAHTVLTVAFTATVQLGSGYDAACVTTSKLCPVFFPGLVGVQFGPKGEPDPEVHPGGNRTTYAVTSNACVAAGAAVNEATTSPVEAGTCSLATSGWVNGFCGLSEALTTGTLVTPTAGVGTARSFAVLLEVTDAGGVAYLTGLVAQGGRLGNLHGVGAITAVPEPGVPVGNNCLAKTATRFVLTATVAVKLLD